MVKYIKCSKESYDHTIKDESAIYFITDTKEIFQGSTLYTQSVIAFTGELPGVPIESKIYFNTETLHSYVWVLNMNYAYWYQIGFNYIHPETHSADIIVESMTKKFMTTDEKTKLSGIATEANNYIHPITSGNKHIPSGGATGQMLSYNSDGTAAWKDLPESGATNILNGSTTGSIRTIGSPSIFMIGEYAFAEGLNTTASGDYSHAEGNITTASGSNSHSEGRNTTAFGYSSHAEGSYTTASGACSHAEGFAATAYTFAEHVTGQYNKEETINNSYVATNNALVIGNGTSESTLSNAFRVSFDGNVYGLAAFNSTGADYAEWFEWLDQNPNGEERLAKFVALDGEKIKLANSGDEILGIISINPAIVGDAQEDIWGDMYLKDLYGRVQYEEVNIPEETHIIPAIKKQIQLFNEDNTPKLDDDNNQLFEEVIVKEERTTVIRPTRVDTVQKINPNYDNTQEYIPRSKRKEWSTIGLVGKLLVEDDGTCEINGRCNVGINGVGTKSETGYRVMKRLNENLIMVLLK